LISSSFFHESPME